MITAFLTTVGDDSDVVELLLLLVGTRVVTRAKYRISVGRRQGRLPRRPMPSWGVVATIRVREKGGGGGIVVVDWLLIFWC
jgi:hypothetical protein